MTWAMDFIGWTRMVGALHFEAQQPYQPFDQIHRRLLRRQLPRPLWDAARSLVQRPRRISYTLQT